VYALLPIRIHPKGASVCSPMAEHRAHGAGQDQPVTTERPVVHVSEVEAYRVLPRQVRPSRDLPETGDAGLDLQPPHHVGLVARALVRKRWTGADQSHLAANDVEQLRQLVERVPTQ